jgi:hypothetical protein
MTVKWPKDTQAARNAFYGDPGKGEIAGQMVRVVPPFAMYYDGKRVKAIQFHKKAAPALLAALTEIWDACEHDQAKVDAAGVSKYAGAYNHRMVRGSKTKWSNHAYAAAIDLNAGENALGVEKGTMPQFVVDAFCRQGAMWGGWYQGRPDWMHFEFVDNGGRKPKSAAPVYPRIKTEIAPVVGVAAPADELESEAPAAPIAKPAVPAAGGEVRGDPDIWHVQRRLKAMNYNPGDLDGLWGGMTGGAISAFINDRELDLVAPTSFEMFNTGRAKLKAAIAQAESELFVRPVTVERASGDIAVVAKAAPEVVPARRNFFMTVWAAVSAFVWGIVNSVSGYIGAAWDFFTDHRDDIPTDPGFLRTALLYLGKVPTSVWIILAAAGLAVVAFNSHSSVKKITQSVQTGARQ